MGKWAARKNFGVAACEVGGAEVMLAMRSSFVECESLSCCTCLWGARMEERHMAGQRLSRALP